MQLVGRAISAATRCIIYTRVSTAQQATAEKASLNDQLRRCRALATQHGHDDPSVWDDPGRSGTDPRRLDALVQWCEQHPHSGKRRGLVVCYSPDRFARLGTELVGFYTVRLRQAGWDLVYVDLPRTGNAMVDGVGGSLRAELAAEESRIKRERALIGMPQRAALGRWQGGRAPRGYAIGPDGKLVLGEATEVRLVRRLFQQYADGASLEAIGEALGKRATTARQMLANPVYTGTLVWSGRRNGSTAHPVTTPDAHPAIVDQRLFARVAARLREAKPHRKPVVPYLLSGMVRCPCGGLLVGIGGLPAKATKVQRRKYRAYGCRACRAVRIKAAWLERQVLQRMGTLLWQWKLDGSLTAHIDRQLKTHQRAGGQQAKARATLEQQHARLVDAVASGMLDKSDVRAKMEALKAEMARLQERPTAKGLRQQRAEVLAQVAQLQSWIAKFAGAEGRDDDDIRRPQLAKLRDLSDADVRTLRPLLGPWVHDIAVQGKQLVGHYGDSAACRAT
jgi:DNA invertase Pin-like site-specific DNA recombinase